MRSPKYRKTNQNKQRALLVLLCLILLILIGFFVYRHYHTKTPANSGIKNVHGQPVNLNPPTPAEKSESDANKQAIVQQQSQSSQPTGSSPTTKSVSVVITEATATDVKAYATGVFENGGTCTATATQGTQTVTKTSDAFENVSYSQCAPITWDTPLGAGTWSITVSYHSADANGSQTTSTTIK